MRIDPLLFVELAFQASGYQGMPGLVLLVAGGIAIFCWQRAWSADGKIHRGWARSAAASLLLGGLLGGFLWGIAVTGAPDARRLTEDQKKAIIQALNASCSQPTCRPPHVTLFYKPELGETAEFANAFHDVLTRLHWPVSGPTAWTYTREMHGWGVWLVSLYDQTLIDKDTAGVFRRSLAAAGHEIQHEGEGSPCAAEWALFVNELKPEKE